MGVAFVTFATQDQASKVYQDHKRWGCSRNPRSSSLSRTLRARNWAVQFAPRPDEIYWNHLSIRAQFWWLRVILINLFLFIVLFFLTTPAVVVSVLNTLNPISQLQKMVRETEDDSLIVHIAS